MSHSGTPKPQRAALLGLVRSMHRELDPEGTFFSGDAAEILLHAAEQAGLIWTHDGRGVSRWIGPPRVGRPGEQHSDPPSSDAVALLLARSEDLPLRADRRQLFVDAAYTRPEYRGRGHMRELVAATKAHAHALGVRHLALGAVTEHAQAFWEHLGFRRVAIRMELPLLSPRDG